MQIRRAVAFVSIAWFFTVAEAVAVRRRDSASPVEVSLLAENDPVQLNMLAVSSGEVLDAMSKNISTEIAVSLLMNSTNTPPPVKSLLSFAMDQRESGLLRGRHNESASTVMSAEKLAKTKKMLGKMISEAEMKLDLEQKRCAEFDRKQKDLISAARGAIAGFNAAAAEAREHILEATAIIGDIDGTLPGLKVDLKKHQKKCKSDITIITNQLLVVQADLKIMEKILGMTKCSDNFMMFLQADCGRSFITLNSTGFQTEIAMALDSVGLKTAPGQTNTSDEPVSAAKQNAKCTLSKGSCTKLRGRFLMIDAGIREKEAQLKHQLAKTQKDCETTEKDLLQQIKDTEAHRRAQQARLAAATKSQNENEESSRLKNMQLKNLLKQHTKEMKQCRENINGFQSEICAVKKIRGELMKMAGEKIYADNIAVKDCTVSKWRPEKCSATCGGGSRMLLRKIISPARNGGADCPPLEMSEDCGEVECPVDCKMSEWGRWSDCSAGCGGGIRSRGREVEVKALFDGNPCGANTETENCNMQSCDVPCKLSEWTHWSACSKMCNGGLQRRVKDVDVRAKANGLCWKKLDPERLQQRPCNEDACVIKDPNSTLKCNSVLDVVIMLDGSGSLGQRGWDASIKAAEMLVNAFDGAGDVQVAFQLFSGPKKYREAKQCARGSPKRDPLTQCGITWVSHFTRDFKGLKTKISQLKWPRKFTLTSIGLGLAAAELSFGRKEATSLVVVITDGRPMNKARTREAAKDVRKKARLMWVPVTRYAPLKDIRKWATRPKRDNIIKVPSFNALEKPATINNLIAGMCPKVE